MSYHLERIRKDIAKLKVNLTARDRTDIQTLTGLSAASVNNYLTGRYKEGLETYPRIYIHDAANINIDGGVTHSGIAELIMHGKCTINNHDIVTGKQIGRAHV